MKSTFDIYWELSKPRLNLLAIIMAAMGFALGAQKLGGGDTSALVFIFSMLGTGLLGIASAALNQVVEAEYDALMPRTCERPLPSGRLAIADAIKFGAVCSFLGVLLLLFFANSLTAVLGALTVFFYLGVYTPAKRVSSLSTLVGAIPGAMPPLIGWTAAYGRIDWEGFYLFGFLFLWQIPHFLSIAWIYREDYKLGKFPVLSVTDPNGSKTVQQSFLYAVALVALSLIPTLWGITGAYYFWGAALAGLCFLFFIFKLWRDMTLAHARQIFLYSILYLPLVSALLVWDRQFS